MPYNFKSLGDRLPGADQRLELCHDSGKTTVWLELTNTDYITDGTSNNFVTVLIGAVRGGQGWVPIGFGDAARLRHKSIALGNSLGPKIAQFQRAICRSWQTSNLSSLAKGLTVGSDQSSPGFVMKALKTGFDAIGESLRTYSGPRITGFTVDEVVTYLTSRARMNGVEAMDGGLADFEKIAPAPGLTEDAPIVDGGDNRDIKYIKSRKPHGGRFPYTPQSVPVEFQRVIGYGFRGDSRPPSLVKSDGGFNPNFTRPSHIAEAAQKGTPPDSLNLETFIADQFMGGYISVTKSYAMAKAFATGQKGTTNTGPGWIYACFVEGGFLVPRKGTHHCTLPDGTKKTIKVPHNEQEISMPGLLDWEDVVACRKVDASGAYVGSVYLRSSFQKEDPKAYRQVWELLSGAPQ